MAKIFYLGGGTNSRGVLRAVVTLDQLESLLSPDLVTHVGDDFPEACDAPITLIEVSRGSDRDMATRIQSCERISYRLR